MKEDLYFILDQLHEINKQWQGNVLLTICLSVSDVRIQILT